MKKLFMILMFFVSMLFADIGSVTLLEGKALLKRGDKIYNLSLGSKIEKSDVIETLANSKVKIRFVDNTLITIGKESRLDIKDYNFIENDPNTARTELSVTKGAFHTITGQIGKVNPNKFKIKTRNATIGIRGTEIYGNQDKIMCTQGMIFVESSLGDIKEIANGNLVTTIQGQPLGEVTKIKNSDLKDVQDNFGPVSIKTSSQETANSKKAQPAKTEVKDTQRPQSQDNSQAYDNLSVKKEQNQITGTAVSVDNLDNWGYWKDNDKKQEITDAVQKEKDEEDRLKKEKELKEKEKAEAEKKAKEKAEAERLKKEKELKEKEKEDALEKDRKDKAEKAKAEAEAKRKEALEKEEEAKRLEKERLEALAKDQQEEAERLRKEKLAAEAEAEAKRKEALEKEEEAKKLKAEQEKAEKARLEAEKKAKEEAEKARLEAEKKAKEEAEKARLEAEKKAKQKTLDNIRGIMKGFKQNFPEDVVSIMRESPKDIELNFAGKFDAVTIVGGYEQQLKNPSQNSINFKFLLGKNTGNQFTGNYKYSAIYKNKLYEYGGNFGGYTPQRRDKKDIFNFSPSLTEKASNGQPIIYSNIGGIFNGTITSDKTSVVTHVQAGNGIGPGHVMIIDKNGENKAAVRFKANLVSGGYKE